MDAITTKISMETTINLKEDTVVDINPKEDMEEVNMEVEDMVSQVWINMECSNKEVDMAVVVAGFHTKRTMTTERVNRKDLIAGATSSSNSSRMECKVHPPTLEQADLEAGLHLGRVGEVLVLVDGSKTAK